MMNYLDVVQVSIKMQESVNNTLNNVTISKHYISSIID